MLNMFLRKNICYYFYYAYSISYLLLTMSTSLFVRTYSTQRQMRFIRMFLNRLLRQDIVIQLKHIKKCRKISRNRIQYYKIFQCESLGQVPGYLAFRIRLLNRSCLLAKLGHFIIIFTICVLFNLFFPNTANIGIVWILIHAYKIYCTLQIYFSNQVLRNFLIRS